MQMTTTKLEFIKFDKDKNAYIVVAWNGKKKHKQIKKGECILLNQR
jgi:hypothetical protein